MFTGIIAAVGKISRVEPGKGGLRLTIDAGNLGLSDLKVGDSVAVNGACLTLVGRAKKSFEVDVSRETLRCTAGFDRPGEANLEKALRLSDRLDGHLVSGHIDGVGEVVRFEAAGAYDPGFPGRQLNIFQPNNRQLRASVYMADHHLVITEANAIVNDLPAIQFEQSITILDEKGYDFDTNPPDPVRIMPCNRN